MESVSKKNKYDKMDSYVESLFSVFKMVNRIAEQKKDRKFKMISLVIYNYATKFAKEFNINVRDLLNITEQESINLIPIFEYVAYNNIELYDFSSISMEDVDTSKNEDLERFVLTHIYYITQAKNT
jgi:hypothetical protein